MDEVLEFQALSDANKARVRILSEAFDALDSVPPRSNRMEIYRTMARDLADKLPAISRKNKTMSVSSLMRLYAEYKRRGWRALVVAYARKSNYVSLPGPFINFWQETFVQFQVDRSGSQAHQAVLAQLEAWRAGDRESAIPGFAEPPQNQLGKEYPSGWSLPNLLRYKPNRLALSILKHGRGKAKSEFGAMVRQTRKDLKPGMLIMFDDVWQDHDVMFPGAKNLVRPLGLVAIDVASGKQISWGMRPRLPSEKVAGKSVQLKAMDMEMLIADVLCRVGTHPDGVTFLLERGTATVSARVEEFLKKFGVRIERAGVDRLASFYGGLPGAFKGNSRFKAAIESHHNLMHNILSLLPAYVGKNRDVPEHTQGMKLAYAALMRDADRLGIPEKYRNRLSVGALSWDTFMDMYAWAVDFANNRTVHELEGWERRLVTEFRLAANGPWMPMDETILSPAIVSELTANPDLHRVRKMSPQEAWQSGGKMRRIQFAALGEMFVQPEKGLDARIVKRVTQRHEFVIRPTADDPREYIFSSEITTQDGLSSILPSGNEYKVLLNPFSGGEELCVYEMDGRYIGSSCKTVSRIPFGDKERLLPAVGEAASAFAKKAHAASFLARERRAEIVDAALNNELLLAEEKAEKQQKQLATDAQRNRALECDDLEILKALDTVPALPASAEPADDADEYSETSF